MCLRIYYGHNLTSGREGSWIASHNNANQQRVGVDQDHSHPHRLAPALMSSCISRAETLPPELEMHVAILGNECCIGEWLALNSFLSKAAMCYACTMGHGSGH
jgi:hypothetical protein